MTKKKPKRINAKDEATYSQADLERQYAYRSNPHNPEAIAQRLYDKYGTNVTFGPLTLLSYGTPEQLQPLFDAGWLTKEPEGWLTFRHPFA